MSRTATFVQSDSDEPHASRRPTSDPCTAHGAASTRLRELVASHSHPADYEMLGICQLLLEDQETASATFTAGLELARSRDPGSELCGSLMRRVAAI